MKCDFCGRGIEAGTECIYVDATGKSGHFCSSKCEKNLLKLKRKPQKVRWTERYMREKAIRVKHAKPEKEKSKPDKSEGEEKKESEPKKKTKEKKKPKSSKRKSTGGK